MVGFIDKLLFREQEESEELNENELAQPDNRNLWAEQEPVLKPKRAQITSIPTKADNTMEMVLIKANSYEDMQIIARHIKERKVVVVNFEDLDKAVAQRMVDFLSGAVFALDGSPKKVSGGTFIFSSSSVSLSGHIVEEDAVKESSDSFPWLRR